MQIGLSGIKSFAWHEICNGNWEISNAKNFLFRLLSGLLLKKLKIPIFGPFAPNMGKKYFSAKIGLCTDNSDFVGPSFYQSSKIVGPDRVFLVILVIHWEILSFYRQY